MALWISPPLRRSAAAPFNWRVKATFAADRPVGQSLMDERVDQQASVRSPARPTTAQPRGCDHFGGSRLCRYMEAAYSSPLRFSLRGRLRPSLPLSFRGSTRPEGNQSPPHRRLRAWRFADIPTPLPVQNIEAAGAVVIPLSIFSASLALDACTTTSALARQRFCITSATEIALVPATPEPQTIITGSALAPQHLAVDRSRAWGLA
jgi:hypothetical protein